MVVVTHEIGFAREVGDKVVFMDGGVVVEAGDPREVLAQPAPRAHAGVPLEGAQGRRRRGRLAHGRRASAGGRRRRREGRGLAGDDRRARLDRVAHDDEHLFHGIPRGRAGGDARARTLRDVGVDLVAAPIRARSRSGPVRTGRCRRRCRPGCRSSCRAPGSSRCRAESTSRSSSPSCTGIPRRSTRTRCATTGCRGTRRRGRARAGLSASVSAVPLSPDRWRDTKPCRNQREQRADAHGQERHRDEKLEQPLAGFAAKTCDASPAE